MKLKLYLLKKLLCSSAKVETIHNQMVTVDRISFLIITDCATNIRECCEVAKQKGEENKKGSLLRTFLLFLLDLNQGPSD